MVSPWNENCPLKHKLNIKAEINPLVSDYWKKSLNDSPVLRHHPPKSEIVAFLITAQPHRGLLRPSSALTEYT